MANFTPARSGSVAVEIFSTAPACTAGKANCRPSESTITSGVSAVSPATFTSRTRALNSRPAASGSHGSFSTRSSTSSSPFVTRVERPSVGV